MRTTITIDEHLLAEAKQAAARTGRTLTAVIEDALRESLARHASATRERRVRLPTFGRGGLMAGVDLDSSAAAGGPHGPERLVILCDVNVLVYAHREDAERHAEYRAWLEGVLAAPDAFGVSELVLSGFLRVVTHPRVFRVPTPLDEALRFVGVVLARPNCVRLDPGDRHWAIFEALLREGAGRGNLVPDAYLAAIAIESGSEWLTTDRGFSRWKGLRWRHPLG